MLIDNLDGHIELYLVYGYINATTWGVAKWLRQRVLIPRPQVRLLPPQPNYGSLSNHSVSNQRLDSIAPGGIGIQSKPSSLRRPGA